MNYSWSDFDLTLLMGFVVEPGCDLKNHGASIHMSIIKKYGFTRIIV